MPLKCPREEEEEQEEGEGDQGPSSRAKDRTGLPRGTRGCVVRGSHVSFIEGRSWETYQHTAFIRSIERKDEKTIAQTALDSPGIPEN